MASLASVWRSHSSQNLADQVNVVRSRTARARSFDQGVDVGAREQLRLYQELPFMVLPGMRSTSVKRSRSVNNFKIMQAMGGRSRAGTIENPVHDASIHPGEVEEGAIEIEMPRFTHTLIRSSTIALLSSFVFGYNTGVVNAAESVVFPGKSLQQWSLVVSMFVVGGAIGAYNSGTAADKFGRKSTLLLNAAFALLSGLLMALAPNMAVLIFGR